MNAGSETAPAESDASSPATPPTRPFCIASTCSARLTVASTSSFVHGRLSNSFATNDLFGKSLLLLIIIRMPSHPCVKPFLSQSPRFCGSIQTAPAMTGPFLINDARIRELSATRQGRVSIGGFTYQASYAAARLASMLARQPILDLDDFPMALRYDWAEDLDELDSGGRTILTQCKRIDDIGQPAKLAEVLLSFAPKLLWTESGRRSELRFRLVCTDPRFRGGDAPLLFSANAATKERARTLEAFAGALATPPTGGSDRALWQSDAEAFGGEALFDAMWKAAEGVYLRGDAIVGDPSGMPLLAAERAALDLLLRFSEVERASPSPSRRAPRTGRRGVLEGVVAPAVP